MKHSVAWWYNLTICLVIAGLSMCEGVIPRWILAIGWILCAVFIYLLMWGEGIREMYRKTCNEMYVEKAIYKREIVRLTEEVGRLKGEVEENKEEV